MSDPFALHNVVVRVQHHFWTRRKTVLDGLCLSLGAGKMAALLGCNGAGKTTALRVLMGLLRPDAGSGHLFGAPLGSRVSRRQVGFAPEQPALPLDTTPLEFVSWVARVRGADAATSRKQALAALAPLGVAALARQRIRSLSKGMRQRVGLAQAIVGEPRLLVLDEPLSGLDPLARREVHALLRAERARGAAVLFATHSLEEVVEDCDVAAILVAGRRAHFGTPTQLLALALARVEGSRQAVRMRVRGLSDSQGATLFAGALHMAHAASQWHAEMPDLQAANALIDQVRQQGGIIVQVSETVRSLEILLSAADGTP